MAYIRISEVLAHAHQGIVIPKGHLDIPRHEMPQISAEDIPEFIDFLKHSGCPVSRVEVPADKLKATQKQFNTGKVIHLMSNLPVDKPIIISDDNHILDGHHTWLAKYNLDPKSGVDCYRIGQDIGGLLNTSRLFHKTFNKKVNEDKMIEDIMDHRSLINAVKKVLREAEVDGEKSDPPKDEKTDKITGKKREKILINPEIRPDKITEPYRVQGSTDK